VCGHELEGDPVASPTRNKIEPSLCTVEVASGILGVSRFALYRLIRANKLPAAVHMGSRVRVNREMLTEYISTGGAR
jgi:excisionase family DNA binding protein